MIFSLLTVVGRLRNQKCTKNKKLFQKMKKSSIIVYICKLVIKYFIDEKSIDFFDTPTVNC